MVGFVSELNVEVMRNGTTRVLLSELKYNSEVFSIVVPKGFKTDYASTPRFLWPIIPPSGKYTMAAVLHDYLYTSGSVTRKIADDIFKEAMISLDVSRWKVCVMYYAVRVFGKDRYLAN
jgi:hypothetical protein